MQLVSLSLRNYRVFDTLDLEIPPGLVGIYGPNGAGKSTLLESILWCLYGRSRTSKNEIRTSMPAGANNSECTVELVFQHEGHHYRIRRWLTGTNANVKARAFAGDAVVADGATEVGKYVRSILGMDEGAFRSSVFAEQKQLAAFSDQTPEARRKLVLQLLGIMPLERARDQARADSRRLRGDYERLAGLLPEIAHRETRAKETAEEAVAATSAHHVAADTLARVEVQLHSATQLIAALDETRRSYEVIKAEGRAARDRRDRAEAAVVRLGTELAELDAAAVDLPAMQAAAALRPALENHLGALHAWERAARSLNALAVPTSAPTVDDAPLEAAAATLATAQAHVSDMRAQAAASLALWGAAKAAADRTTSLEADEPCPLCGQELGIGFAAGVSHRLDERDRAAVQKAADIAALEVAQTAFREAVDAHTAHADRVRRQRQAAEVFVRERGTHEAAAAAVAVTRHELGERSTDREEVERWLRDARTAGDAAVRMQGRFERRPGLLEELAAQRDELRSAERRRQDLLGAAKALAFDPKAYTAANDQRTTVEAHLNDARRVFQQAQQAAAHSESARSAAEQLLEEAQIQHTRLRSMEDDVTVVSRTAELLHGFRQTVVAAIGPRLQIQASELFGELTAGDYDGLEVDPDTYAIRIIDQGVAYGTERFSGSEIDLANLALRVAISEHLRFQSGGQVGLLVLDEALASLDADRKDRMLSALTRLSGRFRQILVVTHSPEVKEQLPQAIEVVRRPGRRATARAL